MLKEVVASVMLVMKKGVEPNGTVEGFESVVVDVLTEDNKDRR